MGYDVTRFDGEVDEELLCPICSGVLEDPLQATHCEHAFCSCCINDWLKQQQSCPIDRGALRQNQLKPVPRILRNLLSRLSISCSFVQHGCKAAIKLDSLTNHVAECEYNPKRLMTCEKGCGLTLPKDELLTHNCVKELRSLVEQQQKRISSLQSESTELKLQHTELKRELHALKESMRLSRLTATSRNSAPETELLRWASSLPAAHVTRWGGMISTPDVVLQTVIKRALLDSACPTHIVNDLMDNSHERRWPLGLATLESRQLNRRLYDNYTCKRIPGKQAVVVMACENTHMPEDMITDPGLVMIFAHGVE